jgi:hypothetical protein
MLDKYCEDCQHCRIHDYGDSLDDYRCSHPKNKKLILNGVKKITNPVYFFGDCENLNGSFQCDFWEEWDGETKLSI